MPDDNIIKIIHYLKLVLLIFGLSIANAFADDVMQCQVTSSVENLAGGHGKQLKDDFILTSKAEQFIKLPAGKHQFLLNCTSQKQGVLSFSASGLENNSFFVDGKKISRLTSSQIAYLTPDTNFQARLLLTKQFSGKFFLKWSALNQFVSQKQQNLFVVSLFYGMCFTLALYVLILGSRLNDKRFYYYSFYMVSVAIFFLLQEGQLNLFLPLNRGQNDIITQMFFAGLTVYLATRFLIRLLDLDHLWPKLSLYLLVLPANIVIGLTLLLFIVNNSVFSIFSSIISYLTLYIIAGNLYLTGRAAWQKVHTANIVFIALVVLMAAMILRVAIPDMDIFLRKYALFFSITLESFLLAMATAERIKQLNIEGRMAKHEAITDELCNIYNRRGWIQQAEKVLALQRSENGYCVVFFIDLNKFKQINDNYGHAIGDEVLIAISMLIKHQVKSKDAVGRIGGDEFVVISYFKDRENADELLHRLKKRLQKTIIQCSAGEIEITSSVGYQVYSEPPSGIEQILKEADRVMYQHKLAFE